MVTYDLQPIQDFFNVQAEPREVAFYLYRLIANYAKGVDEEHLEEMQTDVAFLSLLVEQIESVEPIKNQSPKV